jgi:hypothetical protein
MNEDFSQVTAPGATTNLRRFQALTHRRFGVAFIAGLFLGLITMGTIGVPAWRAHAHAWQDVARGWHAAALRYQELLEADERPSTPQPQISSSSAEVQTSVR